MKWHIRTLRQNQVVLLVLIFIALSCRSSHASSIEFSYVRVNLVDQQYFLDAQASLELNRTIERGVQSGVPIFFNADARVMQVRPFFWDKKIGEFRRRFSLVYYELTRHYRVSAVGEEFTRNFRSLLDALEYIGTIRELPIVRAEELDDNLNYRGEITLALDVSALPLLLTPQTLVSSVWRLRSDEFEWQIN